MSSMKNNIKGIDLLLKKLDHMGANTDDIVRVSLSEKIAYVKGQAVTLAPKDTGALANSIHTKIKVNRGHIRAMCVTNLEYAPYQEFGTGSRGIDSPSPPKYPGNLDYDGNWTGIPAQPFMYPALKDNEPWVIEGVKRDLLKAIRRYKKGV